jgi:SAM-dependent methyltransferase
VAFYARDLAYVHDIGFGGFAETAAPALVRRFRRAGLRDGLVVDLGCGSGILARALIDAGFEVLGVDVSGAMLEIARCRAPEAAFRRGSAFAVDFPPACAVTAIGECLSYSNEAPAGLRELHGLFRRVHAALPTGGLFVFDLASPGRERARPRRTWHSGEDWLVCLEASEDPISRELTRQIVLFREHRGGWRRSDELHRLTLHDPDEVLNLLAECGFGPRQLPGYGRELRFRRGHTGFAATRL